MDTLISAALVVYFLIGVGFEIALISRVGPERLLYAMRLVSDVAGASGLTHILFILLWPVWLVIALFLIKKENGRAEGFRPKPEDKPGSPDKPSPVVRPEQSQ